MKRLGHLAALGGAVIDLLWLAQGARLPSLGGPAPAWLLAVLGLLVALVVAAVATGVALCAQAVMQPRG
jgi:hypothetical protein